MKTEESPLSFEQWTHVVRHTRGDLSLREVNLCPSGFTVVCVPEDRCYMRTHGKLRGPLMLGYGFLLSLYLPRRCQDYADADNH